MNKNIVLVTDTNADVPENYKNKIIYVPQYFKFETEEEYYADMDRALFYEKLSKEKVITSAPNMDLIKETFKDEVMKGNDIICISFSSKMSSTYNLFNLMAEEIVSEFSEYEPKIEVIDSLSAGAGQGMICQDVINMIEEGQSFEDIVSTIKNNINKYKVFFIVNDFKYLVQGGRVSQTTANIGRMLNIKPILSIKDGSIQAIAKPRGLKFAFETIANYIGSDYEKIEFIKASDLEITKDFETYIKKTLNDENIASTPLNLVTCSHLGPDSAAIAVKFK